MLFACKFNIVYKMLTGQCLCPKHIYVDQSIIRSVTKVTWECKNFKFEMLHVQANAIFGLGFVANFISKIIKSMPRYLVLVPRF